MSRYDDHIKCATNPNYSLLIHHHHILFVTILCIISVWFMTFKKINDVSRQFEKSAVFWGQR